MVPIDEMPMIADASLSFSQVQEDMLESPSKPGHPLDRAATTLVDNAELESGSRREREAEKEKEQLQAALRASEAALERIKQERDEAKQAEQLLEAAGTCWRGTSKSLRSLSLARAGTASSRPPQLRPQQRRQTGCDIRFS